MNSRIILFLLFPAALLSACAGGKVLPTEPARVDESAVYDVIYYGGRYQDDLETMAILDKTGDPYMIEPRAPRFYYHTEKNVPGKIAYESARRWVASFNPAFMGTKISSISGPEGTIIGYEIRPLYQPFTYGLMDVLLTSYYLDKNGTVKAWIRLRTEIANHRLNGNHDGTGGLVR